MERGREKESRQLVKQWSINQGRDILPSHLLTHQYSRGERTTGYPFPSVGRASLSLHPSLYATVVLVTRPSRCWKLPHGARSVQFALLNQDDNLPTVILRSSLFFFFCCFICCLLSLSYFTFSLLFY